MIEQQTIDNIWLQSGITLRGNDYGDYYGGAVSMNTLGTRIAISAKLDNNNELINVGSVSVYEKNNKSTSRNIWSRKSIW